MTSRIFPIITIFALLYFFTHYIQISRPRSGTTEWIERIVNPPRFNFIFNRHKLQKHDIIPIAIILILFGTLAFFGLGDTKAPQSFVRFTPENPQITIEIEPSQVDSIMFYTGLWTGHYTLELSADGINWQEQFPKDNHNYSMDQPHSHLFKWRYADINDYNQPTTFIRISASRTPMELGELAVFSNNEKVNIVNSNAPELFDESNLVPNYPTYTNGMYFDEIYHARTAYEQLKGVSLYENSHPPLGKSIISIGIAIFGMTPFGWRCVGALFGVILLAVFYTFVKNIFGRSKIAICATLLIGFDFMRFVQTRIATIDTYGVFFILLAFFFMYRYISTPLDESQFSKFRELALCGVMFGIGCASKWIVIYAGAGLFAVYTIHLAMIYISFRDSNELGFAKYLTKTILWSLLFFIVIPTIIYILSYIPYGHENNLYVNRGMLWNPKFYKLIWDNQVFMFTYHSKLTDGHNYSSQWWQWLFNIRPILYYLDTQGSLKSAFAAFGNPVVWWGGLLAMIAMAVRTIKFRDGIALFILIGYLSQLLPWVFISRVVFAYHYFPSTLFLTLAIAHVFNSIAARTNEYRAIYGYTASSGVLFTMFYPVLTGRFIHWKYPAYFLRWIPDMWPF